MFYILRSNPSRWSVIWHNHWYSTGNRSKTTDNTLRVSLDSSSIPDFAMDLCFSVLIQLSVRLSCWPSPCTADRSHNTQQT